VRLLNRIQIRNTTKSPSYLAVIRPLFSGTLGLMETIIEYKAMEATTTMAAIPTWGENECDATPNKDPNNTKNELGNIVFMSNMKLALRTRLLVAIIVLNL